MSAMTEKNLRSEPKLALRTGGVWVFSIAIAKTTSPLGLSGTPSPVPRCPAQKA